MADSVSMLVVLIFINWKIPVDMVTEIIATMPIETSISIRVKPCRLLAKQINLSKNCFICLP